MCVSSLQCGAQYGPRHFWQYDSCSRSGPRVGGTLIPVVGVVVAGLAAWFACQGLPTQTPLFGGGHIVGGRGFGVYSVHTGHGIMGKNQLVAAREVVGAL